MATEIFGYGRLPLAFSARCFTARRYNLSKDSCEFRCLDHPDGMPLATREGQPFLAVNGIQTQSAQIYNLIRELDELSQLGVDVLRISPQFAHTVEVVKLFRQCLDRDKTADDAAREIANLMPAAACNGYWHGRPGLEQVTVPARAVEA
jgi:collagenase-like PrtC family protease